MLPENLLAQDKAQRRFLTNDYYHVDIIRRVDSLLKHFNKAYQILSS